MFLGIIYIIGEEENYHAGTITANLHIYDIVADTWSRGADFPETSVQIHSGDVWEENIYSIGGTGGGYTGQLKKYSIAGNVWSSLANTRPTIRGGAGIINGKLYSFGGSSTGGAGADPETQIYDIATNVWSDGPDMIQAVVSPKVSVLNSKIYCFGGSTDYQNVNTTTTSNVQIYDTNTNMWASSLNQIPQSGGLAESAGGVSNGKMYVMYGASSTATTGTDINLQYTVTSAEDVLESANIKTVMPASRSNLNAQITGWGNYTFAVGGYNGGYKDDVYRFDTINNTWATCTLLPSNRGWGSAIVVEDYLYYFGGKDLPGGGTTNYQNDLFRYNLFGDGTTGTWVTMASLTGSLGTITGVAALSIATYNNKIYIIGGRTNLASPSDLFAVYDIATDSWDYTLNQLPAPLRESPSCGVINGILYVAGGNDATVNAVSTLYSYNIGTNTWDSGSALAQIPTGVMFAATLVLYDKLYVFGGQTTTANTDNVDIIQIYNPIYNTWITSPIVLPEVITVQGGGVVNGKIYLMGGQLTGGVPTNVCWEFPFVGNGTPLLGEWYVGASLPDGKTNTGSCSSNGDIYIMGGKSYLSELSTSTYKYQTNNNTWYHTGNLATAVQGAFSGEISGNVYLIGGSTEVDWSVTSDVVNRYNISTDTWSISSSSLPVPLSRGHSTVRNDKLYCIGGQDGGNNPSGLVQIYNPSNDSWATPPLLTSMSVGNIGGTRGPYAGDPYKRGVAWPGDQKGMYGDKIIMCVGFVGGTKVIRQYDTTTDSWSLLSDNISVPAGTVFPGGSSWEGGATVINNGILYYWNGMRAYDTAQQALYDYDIAGNSWGSSLTVPPAAFGYQNGAIYNGIIYSIGGDSGDNVVPENVAIANVYSYNIGTDTWAREADLPLPKRSGFCGVINGNIYYAGGSNNAEPITDESWTATANVYKYNIAANVWTTMPNLMPDGGRTGGGCAILDNQMYCFGGYTSLNAPGNTKKDSDLIMIYNPNGDKWTISDTVMPSGATMTGGGAVGNKIFIGGGIVPGGSYHHNYPDGLFFEYSPHTLAKPISYVGGGTVDNDIWLYGNTNSNSLAPPPGDAFNPTMNLNFFEYPSNAIQIYNPDSDSWETSSLPLKQDIAQGGCGKVGGTRLFIYGGENKGYLLDQCTELFINEGKESQGTASYLGNIYSIGGTDYTSNTLATNEMVSYNISSNIWTTMTPIPSNVKNAFCGSMNNKIYVAGGQTSNDGGSITDVTYEYDPALNTWSTKTSMSTPSSTGQALVRDNKLYCIGGISTGNVSINAIQVYTPSTNLWANATVTIPGGEAINPGGGVSNDNLYIYGGNTTISDENKATIEFSPNLTTGTGVGLIYNTAIKGKTSPGNFGNFNMYAEEVLLDTAERTKFYDNPHEYLITQVQKLELTPKNLTVGGIEVTGNSVIPQTISSGLFNFNHPVKYLMWQYMPQLSDYTNNDEPRDLFDNSVFPLQQLAGNTGTVNVFPKSIEMFCDNTLMSMSKSEGYYRFIQAMKNNNTFINGIPTYYYTFEMDNSRIQPSGSLNMSRIDSMEIQSVMQWDPTRPFVVGGGTGTGTITGNTYYMPETTTFKQIIFAENYNILRIEGGQCGLAYIT